MRMKGPKIIKLLFKFAFFKNKMDLYRLSRDRFIPLVFKGEDIEEKIIVNEKDSKM